MVHGNGSLPDMPDLLAVAQETGININWAKDTADKIKKQATDDLSVWL